MNWNLKRTVYILDVYMTTYEAPLLSHRTFRLKLKVTCQVSGPGSTCSGHLQESGTQISRSAPGLELWTGVFQFVLNLPMHFTSCFEGELTLKSMRLCDMI
jgi:hypothetical protein